MQSCLERTICPAPISGTPKSRGTVPGPTLGVRQVGPIPTRARGVFRAEYPANPQG
jgi:hypothetical protein